MNGGTIYGGFIRDMLKIKVEICDSEYSHIYPTVIDVVTSHSNYNNIIDCIKNERGYLLITKREDLKQMGTGDINHMKTLEVTSDRGTILLDITILTPRLISLDLVMSFFLEHLPRDFEANQFMQFENLELKLNLSRNNLFAEKKFGQITLSEDEEKSKISKIKEDIKNKIAVLMTAINNVSEDSLKMMLNIGFKIISADRSVQWIEKPLDKDIKCLVCNQELKSRWVAIKNIVKLGCNCEMIYLCASIDSLSPRQINNCIISAQSSCPTCSCSNEA